MSLVWGKFRFFKASKVRQRYVKSIKILPFWGKMGFYGGISAICAEQSSWSHIWPINNTYGNDIYRKIGIIGVNLLI